MGLVTAYAQLPVISDYEPDDCVTKSSGRYKLCKVLKTTDPFTGTVNCQQLLLSPDVGGFHLFTTTDPVWRAAFNKYGLKFIHMPQTGRMPWPKGHHAFPDGEVLFKFPDGTIHSFNPSLVVVDSDDLAMVTLTSGDAIRSSTSSGQLIYDLLTSPADVLLRLDGPRRDADLTIPHEFLVELAAGFGQICFE
tara:strand:- start:856 stop:1431 length:576 start_codon:yes stop_codon:yes gene_type:complete